MKKRSLQPPVWPDQSGGLPAQGDQARQQFTPYPLSPSEGIDPSLGVNPRVHAQKASTKRGPTLLILGLLIPVLALGLFFGVRAFQDHQRTQAWQLHLQQATQALQADQADEALKTLLEMQVAVETHNMAIIEALWPDYTYARFLAAYQLQYYSEAVAQFAQLPLTFRQQQPPSVYEALISYAALSGQQTWADAWLEEAQQLAPQYQGWSKLAEGTYQILLEKRPDYVDESGRLIAPATDADRADLQKPQPNQQGQNAGLSALQVPEAEAAYQAQAWDQAVARWKPALDTRQLSAQEWNHYFWSCIHLEDIAAYRWGLKVLNALKNQAIDPQQIPAFYGTTQNAHVQGGEWVQVQGQLLMSRYTTYHLAQVPKAWLKATGDQQGAGAENSDGATATADRPSSNATAPNPFTADGQRWVFSHGEALEALGDPADTTQPQEIELQADSSDRAQPRPALFLNAREQTLYTINPEANYAIEALDLNTKTVTTLRSEGADHLFLAGHHLYYRDLSDKSLRRMDLETLQETVLVSQAIRHFVLDDQGILYIDQSQGLKVFALPWQGGEPQQVLATRTFELLSAGQRIYYVNAERSNRIWTSLRNGDQARELVAADHVSNLAMDEAKGQLYFDHWGITGLDLHRGDLKVIDQTSAAKIYPWSEGLFFANANFDYHKMKFDVQTQTLTRLEPQ